MFRSASLCVALVLGLSACKAEAKDFTEVYAQVKVAHEKCHASFEQLTSAIDPEVLAETDKWCGAAIAGSWGLSNDPDAETLAKWMVANPDKASRADLDAWDKTLEYVDVLAAYVGPENLPTISAVAKRLAEMEAAQKPI